MDESASNPPHSYLDEFAVWSQSAQTSSEDREAQAPAEELLGEHHLMGLVSNAMEAEALRLKQGAELRMDFWSDVVDFIGNFVHMCHRRKEEEVFYPAAVRGGLIETDRSDALEHEHKNAKEMTLGICAGVESGDWEKVMRLVSMYVFFMRNHMRTEERELVEPFLRELDSELRDEVAVAFREVEASALNGRDRQHYLTVVRRLCDSAGVAHGFDGMEC